MLVELFPQVHQRYTSLPVLGTTMEDFARFLLERGYPVGPIRRHIRTARKVDAGLRRRGARSFAEVTRARLRACGPPPGRSQDDEHVASTTRVLEAHLDRMGLFAADPPVASPTAVMLSDYRQHLAQVHGMATSTIHQHVVTASAFLAHACGGQELERLSALTAARIEDFVKQSGQRLGRESLQHTVGQLRSFLRFLALRGEAPCGLDSQIDMPRVYGGERLPRSLPWETVTRLLASIDRSTALGRRDHAMFLLFATYGLRTSDIVQLKLEDIDWRAGRLRVHQLKTATPLELPLTDEVATSLVKYLRHGRPALSHREIFVRHCAPAGVLKRAGVSSAFRAWSARSGLGIPFQGPHCLRHSFAVRLLRKGVSLKAIGDVLGHRTMASTTVYLRLAVEDLRGVALDLPDGRQRRSAR
jgi:site-specific recombinase XerD